MDDNYQALVERYKQQAMEYAARGGILGTIPINEPMVTNSNRTDYETFLKLHPGKGKLKVQLSTAGGTFPVEGGSVEVSRDFGGERRVFFKELSNQSGIVENIELPALPADYSQNSATATDSSTDYNVAVYHPDFVNEPYLKIGIYDGVETLLPVALRPIVR